MVKDQDFVPTISIAPLFGDDNDAKLMVAAQIDKVCRNSGFFYISDHGVDINELKRVSNKLHNTITEEEKQRIAIAAWNPANKKQIRNGYQPATSEKPVEMFCYLNPEFTADHPAIMQDLPGYEVNVWPDKEEHPGFQEYCEAHYRKMVLVTRALLRGFSLALGKDEDFFGRYFRGEDTLSSVVLIRYPEMENYPNITIAEDGTELGYGEHQDVDLLVFFASSHVQCMQAQTRNLAGTRGGIGTGKEGVYRDVQPDGNNFLVNVGTYMHYITHGAYRSVWHRVKHRNIDRLSLPFFVNLSYNDAIEPFFPLEEDETHEKNPPLKYGEYLKTGLRDLIVSNGQR